MHIIHGHVCTFCIYIHDVCIYIYTLYATRSIFWYPPSIELDLIIQGFREEFPDEPDMGRISMTSEHVSNGLTVRWVEVYGEDIRKHIMI